MAASFQTTLQCLMLITRGLTAISDRIWKEITI